MYGKSTRLTDLNDLSVISLTRESVHRDPRPLIDLVMFFENELAAEKETIASNFQTNNWHSNRSSLLYQIAKTPKFAKGNGIFCILTSKSQGIIGAGGVCRSKFHSEIALFSIRSWTSKRYRGQSVQPLYIQPVLLDWCLLNGIKMYVSTFNDYNEPLFESLRKFSNNAPVGHFYHGLEFWPRKVFIQYTWQWLIYKKIDPNFNFDFDQLGHVGKSREESF